MGEEESPTPKSELEPVDAVLGVGVFARLPADVDSEDRLLSISVFARRSRLSMKALRLYERQGLLTPVFHGEVCRRDRVKGPHAQWSTAEGDRPARAATRAIDRRTEAVSRPP